MRIIERIKCLSEKDRIIVSNIIGAFLVKGAALIVSLLTMPAYMRYFVDQEILGVWFTVLSVLTWILSFDLGIGNGLRNQLTEALSLGARKSAKELISSAYWMVGILVLGVLLLGMMVIPHVNWNKVFNVSSSLVTKETLVFVMKYAFLGIMLQFYLRLISSVLYALQKSAVNNFVALITSVLQLLCVLVAPRSTPEDNLKVFSVAYIFCSNIPLFLATIVVFCVLLKDCRPAISSVRRKNVHSVLSLGGLFFLCQVLYMIIANTNEFFIAQYTAPAHVVEYQIYNRVFSLISMVFMLALSPVWSAVSKAQAENDFAWMKRLNRILLGLSCVAVTAEFLLVPVLQCVINIWLREETITVNYTYALCFAAYGSTMVFQSAVSTITNGVGRMKTQMVCYGIGVFAKVLMIHIGILITGDWIVVVAVNVIILMPYCVLQQLDTSRYINACMHNKKIL